MKDLVAYIAGALVNDKNALTITEDLDGKQRVITIKAENGEIGKLIGKQGNIANSIRTIMKAASDPSERVILNITD